MRLHDVDQVGRAPLGEGDLRGRAEYDSRVTRPRPPSAKGGAQCMHVPPSLMTYTILQLRNGQLLLEVVSQEGKSGYVFRQLRSGLLLVVMSRGQNRGNTRCILQLPKRILNPFRTVLIYIYINLTITAASSTRSNTKRLAGVGDRGCVRSAK